MKTQDKNTDIIGNYAKRDDSGKSELYAYHRPEVLCQDWRRADAFSQAVFKKFGSDLSQIRVLDVGCGNGAVLRKFVEWGVSPQNCVGTEFLISRLNVAKSKSHSAMKWKLGNLDALDKGETFDIVMANTVFSSILSHNERAALANSMWQRLRVGGIVLLFDFKVNNPNNPDVLKFTPNSAVSLFPGKKCFYKSLVFAPPISRRVARFSGPLNALCEILFSFTHSHYVMSITRES